jgi:Ser/Thr protein kinase RdoA (MazF antagonist)
MARPVWRADLLESADGPPGSFDRTHYHPALQGWEPGRRVFDRDLSAHPVEWVGARLAALETLLAEAGVASDPADARDAEALRGCLAEVMGAVSRLLERVWRGELARPPAPAEPAGPAGELTAVRVGWL